MEIVSAQHEILVVDDSDSNLLLYGTLLARAGFMVRKAKNGADALAAVGAKLPSLMLLDYMMPGMNGGEVIRLLRARPETEDLPIIVLTASVESDDIDTALAAGADDYINKPVDSRILLARIRSIIKARADHIAAGAASERDALRLELAEAQAVQRAQLPSMPAAWPGWTAMGGVVPSGQVAGDVFDLFGAANGQRFTTLIDVSGHGTASALVAAETRIGLRNLLGQYPLQEAIAILNNRMVDRELGKYACLAVVETNNDRVRIVNAGLPPVVVMSTNGNATEVAGCGFPPGMFRDAEYNVIELTVTQGDRVIIVSDGLTEPFSTPDDTRGTISRFRLNEPQVQSWTSLELEQHLTSIQGPSIADDATLIVLERT